MRRREFIAGISAAAWPLAARAERRAVPVIGFFSGASADTAAERGRAFRKGLGETGHVDNSDLINDTRSAALALGEAGGVMNYDPSSVERINRNLCGPRSRR
jgi:hypothetical protein